MTHIYADVCSDEGEQLIIVNETGRLSLYTPLIDHLTADDWTAG